MCAGCTGYDDCRHPVDYNDYAGGSLTTGITCGTGRTRIIAKTQTIRTFALFTPIVIGHTNRIINRTDMIDTTGKGRLTIAVSTISIIITIRTIIRTGRFDFIVTTRTTIIIGTIARIIPIDIAGRTRIMVNEHSIVTFELNAIGSIIAKG
jgi:hypothetical protein